MKIQTHACLYWPKGGLSCVVLEALARAVNFRKQLTLDEGGGVAGGGVAGGGVAGGCILYYK